MARVVETHVVVTAGDSLVSEVIPLWRVVSILLDSEGINVRRRDSDDGRDSDDVSKARGEDIRSATSAIDVMVGASEITGAGTSEITGVDTGETTEVEECSTDRVCGV